MSHDPPRPLVATALVPSHLAAYGLLQLQRRPVLLRGMRAVWGAEGEGVMKGAAMTNSFTAWKRRIGVGTRILCVENQYRPEVTGTIRTVNKVQVNSIRASSDGFPIHWTAWPPASAVTCLDANTVAWHMFHDDPKNTRPDLLTLRILPEGQ